MNRRKGFQAWKDFSIPTPEKYHRDKKSIDRDLGEEKLVGKASYCKSYGMSALQNYSYNATTGNLSIRAGVNYTYGDTNHDHAVTQMGSDSYSYDNDSSAGRVYF